MPSVYNEKPERKQRKCDEKGIALTSVNTISQ